MANPAQPLYLPAFDTIREHDFVVQVPFPCRGHELRRGQQFDKSLVTTRLLRTLYEQRRIAVVPRRLNGHHPAPQLPAADVEPPQALPLDFIHRGFGKWFVKRGEEYVSGPHGKDDREAALAAAQGLDL